MRRFTSILELLLMAVVAVFTALYMSAPVGWTFMLLIGAGLLFSLFVVGGIAFFHAADVDCDINTTMLYKGEILTLTITADNKTLIPVPDIIITTAETPILISVGESNTVDTENSAINAKISANSAKISANNAKISANSAKISANSANDNLSLIRFAIASRRSDNFAVTYKAVHWGGGEVGIKNVRLGDFTGLFSFPWHMGRDKNIKEKLLSIRVFPNIPEIPSDNALIRSAVAALRFDSETEETTETDAPFIQSGFPGYTHRDYEPGDPLKRINWKLSAKRGNYLIRLDDETESFRQVIVLDPMGGGGIIIMERAVETVLAIALSMVKQGLKAGVWYGTAAEGTVTWNFFECVEPGDVTELQTIFAMYDFVMSKAINRFPDEASPGGSVLFVSPAADLNVPIAEAHERGIHIEAVSTYPAVNAKEADVVWTVADGFNMVKE
jgi:uncharacterized protein (DUF58 family)